MTKYIFVTGGVVSGLGKGITAASLGRLLKARGLKVAAQKLDPYINVDPGTMSPYQHGEVYVTEDGAETDLDLGHYERFIDEDLNKYSNLTTGKVYWSERTIVNMLKNPTYLGHMVQGRHQVKSYKVHTIVPIPEDDWFWVENTHEAIIDQQTFDRAQELLEKNVRTSPKAKTVYLFSGFLRCGDCGRGMTRRTSKGYTYYSCKTYIMKNRGLCTSHTIRDELVEQVVFETVKKQIALCETLAQIIDEINQAPVVRNQSTRLDKLLKTQEQELHKITNLCDNLYIDWKSGDLTREEYHRMKAKFEEQAEEIRQTIANLQEEQTFVSNGITSDDPYLQTFLKYKNIDHLERGIVVALIKQINIYEGKQIDVEFNFADQHQRILDFIEANRPKLSVVRTEAV